MSTFEVHPEAKKRFAALAEDLFSRLREVPREDVAISRREFEPDTYVAATLTEKDIGELRHLGTFNPYTLAVGELHFDTGTKAFKLGVSDCQDFERLVDRISAQAPFADLVARDTVRGTAIDWISHRLEGRKVPDFMNFLDEQVGPQVATFKAVVPITFLHVRESLPFGRIVLEPLGADFFESLAPRVAPNADEQTRAEYREWLLQYRKKVQGHTGGTLTVSGEPTAAVARALSEVNHAVSLLRFFAPEAQIAQARSFAAPYGLLPSPSHDVWLFGPETLEPHLHDRSMQPPMPVPWSLSDKELEQLRKLGLDELSTLAKGESLWPLEKTLEESLLLFSRAAIAPSPTEKMVFLLVSVETLLLRNTSEPIQQAVADRLAFGLTSDPTERRRIVALFKASYDLRSSFIHHGRNPSDLDTLSDLLHQVWRLLRRILVIRRRFRTKDELLDHIDELKYS